MNIEPNKPDFESSEASDWISHLPQVARAVIFNPRDFFASLRPSHPSHYAIFFACTFTALIAVIDVLVSSVTMMSSVDFSTLPIPVTVTNPSNFYRAVMSTLIETPLYELGTVLILSLLVHGVMMLMGWNKTDLHNTVKIFAYSSVTGLIWIIPINILAAPVALAWKFYLWWIGFRTLQELTAVQTLTLILLPYFTIGILIGPGLLIP